MSAGRARARGTQAPFALPHPTAPPKWFAGAAGESDTSRRIARRSTILSRKEREKEKETMDPVERQKVKVTRAKEKAVEHI